MPIVSIINFESLIKVEVAAAKASVPVQLATLNFGPRAAAAASKIDYYGGALSETEMARVYGEALYAQFDLEGYRLPYTVLMSFFPNPVMPHMDLDDLKCYYSAQHDTHITPEKHPLNDSALKEKLKQAYKMRRWDNLAKWGERSSVMSRRTLLKISAFDPGTAAVGFSRTDYDTQAVTNLVMDMEVNGRTLRRHTYRHGKLPELSDPDLANNLGISILFLSKDGRPIFPLRNQKGVAIFPNEWGCTVSFAADFPGQVSSSMMSFSGALESAIRNQLQNEFSLAPENVELIPLALCREWFRGGKPQLFMAVESAFSVQDAKRRYKDIEHKIEVAESRFGLFKVDKNIWDHKPSQVPHSIEALGNLVLYNYYKSLQAK